MEAIEPCTSWSAVRFATWWLRSRPFLVPPKGAVRHVRNGTGLGVTLYRHGPFQAQLFIFGPNADAPAHCHPHIDSVDFTLAGGSDFSFSSERNRTVPGIPSMLKVMAGEWHVAKAGAQGGAFMSFQKWLDGLLPTSVELDWTGEPMDLAHEKQMGEANGRT